MHMKPEKYFKHQTIQGSFVLKYKKSVNFSIEFLDELEIFKRNDC